MVHPNETMEIWNITGGKTRLPRRQPGSGESSTPKSGPLVWRFSGRELDGAGESARRRAPSQNRSLPHDRYVFPHRCGWVWVLKPACSSYGAHSNESWWRGGRRWWPGSCRYRARPLSMECSGSTRRRHHLDFFEMVALGGRVVVRDSGTVVFDV